MISGTKIFLVGMPGSGKSTLGKSLAKMFELQFIDLDQEIESTIGKSIEEIFVSEGEEAFRIIEKKELERSIHDMPVFLMATGGGTPCFFNNMETIMAIGLVVFLNVPVETLHNRLIEGKGIQERPLLNSVRENSIIDELTAKLKDRLPYYSQAHIVIEGDDISLEEIKEAIKKYY